MKRKDVGTLALMFLLAPVALGAVKMDRTANLPAELAQDAKDARADLLGFREASDMANKAADALAKGVPGVKKEDRDVERARLIVVLQKSLERVKKHLTGFYNSMSGVLDKLDNSVVADLGDAATEIGSLFNEFNATNREHELTIDNLVKVADMAQGEVEDAQKRRLNGMIANYKFRDRLQLSLQKSQERIVIMQGTAQDKLATMRAAVAGVEARLKELGGEIALVKTLKGEDIIGGTFCAIFGCGEGGMVDSPDLDAFGPSEAIDKLLYGAPRPSGMRTVSVEDNLDYWKNRPRR